MKRSRSMSARVNLRYPDGVRAGSISPSDSKNLILEIVTSGNSARSRPMTSPIVMCARAACALTPALPPGGTVGGTVGGGPRRAR